MEFILAIDQGTHASRALLLDSSGRILSRSLQPVPLSQPRPDHIEQDAEQIVSSVRTALQETLRHLTSGQRDCICACGLTTQRSTVLAWQRNGAALTPAINWQDTRGAPQLEHLESRASAIRKISGLPLSAHYGASKLHWLHQLLGNDPEARFGPLATFLLDRLTNRHEHQVDHSNAQRMQLFDIHTLNWSRQLADWFSVPLQRLPACQPVEHTYGTLADYGVPVTAVCGDQNAAWFGSGIPGENTALVNLGSGAFVLARSTADTGIPNLLCSIASSNQHGCEYLIEGTVNGAGNALHWLEKHHQVTDIQKRLASWLSQVENPPLFLNCVGGLGSPWWQQNLTSEFTQDTNRYSDAELAVAVTESFLFLLQYNLVLIQDHQSLSSLRVSGGLSQIDALCQKLSSLSGLPVERVRDPEASARGVAWLAAGRPQHWQTDSDIQHFEPESDTGITTRYTHFIEQLRIHIESSTNE